MLFRSGGGGIDALLSQAREIGGVKVLGVRVEITNREALRELAEQLRDKLGDAIVLVGAPDGDKASLVLMVSKSITDRYRAGDLIKAVAAHVGGSGGGRPDMAQAGGPNVAGLGAALEAIYGVVQA